MGLLFFYPDKSYDDVTGRAMLTTTCLLFRRENIIEQTKIKDKFNRTFPLGSTHSGQKRETYVYKMEEILSYYCLMLGNCL